MKFHPEVIIFDVDGVLVDTRGSFQRTTLETVKFFTGKHVSVRELHQWKNLPGFNDDWKLSTAWVQDLGFDFTYDQVKAKFVELYWGRNGKGYVNGEKWLLPVPALRRLRKKAELAIFTGRVGKEMEYTLVRRNVRKLFDAIITVDSVARPKPAPDGLVKILNGRDPQVALYLGDNVDDANAARSAKVPFIGVLPRNSEERRQRAGTLRKLGALTIIGRISELERLL
ncbi:MAG: HAD family hydrolase [Candidatus Acidiferrales bacterium]